jgi:hypothetical protein
MNGDELKVPGRNCPHWAVDIQRKVRVIYNDTGDRHVQSLNVTMGGVREKKTGVSYVSPPGCVRCKASCRQAVAAWQ